MIITVFDKATGKVKRVLALSEHAIKRNLREGEDYREGGYTPPPQEGAEALREIRAAERSQGRAVREALLSILPDGPEKARLQKIDDEIAAKRP